MICNDENGDDNFNLKYYPSVHLEKQKQRNKKNLPG